MTTPRKYVLVIAAMAALGFVTAVPANNAQQQKMTTCNARARAQSLSGNARKQYMKSCLRTSGGPSPAMNRQRMKMKSCNTDANAKSLKGAARRSFMHSCLKAS